MESPLFTEEEFKKLLKSLADKKNHSQEESSLSQPKLKRNFFSKLAEISKPNAEEAAFQEVFLAKVQEVEDLKGQLEKVKPALKKLVDDLKESREQSEALKNTTAPKAEFHLLEQRLKKEMEERMALLENIQETKMGVALLEKEKTVFQDEIKKLKGELKAKPDGLEHEEKIARLENENEQYKRALNEREETLFKRREEREREIRSFEEERQRLVEKLAESLSQTQRQSEIIQDLREETNVLRQEHEQGKEYRKKVDQETEEVQNQLSQTLLEGKHLRAALEKQLQDEIRKKEEIKEQLEQVLEEALQERKALTAQLEEWEKKESEKIVLKEQLLAAQEELKKTDQGVLRQEFETKIQHLEEEFQAQFSKQSVESVQKIGEIQEALSKALFENGALHERTTQAEEGFKRILAKKESTYEEMLSRGYAKMKELSQRHVLMIDEQCRLEKALEEKQRSFGQLENDFQSLQNVCQNLKLQCIEKDAEIRKAQQHLAKKVKENTILHDVLERQKIQNNELQKVVDKQKGEIEKMNNHLNIQRTQEEKIHVDSKEKLQAAERITKEWQDKYVTLHQEGQGLKTQLLEMQKIKKHYEHLLSTLSSLKQFLGKTLDTPLWEGETKIKGPSNSSEDFF